MLKLFGRRPDLSMLFLSLFVAGLVFGQSSWGDLLLADTVFGTVRTELGQTVLAVGGALLKTASGFLFWVLLDWVFQPWLRIGDLYHGVGSAPKSLTVRSAFIHGYYILAAAVVLAVSLGGDRVTPAALLLAIPVLLQPIFETELDRSNLAAFAPQLAAQVQVESAWRPEARSKYAAGLAQFTPPTWGDVAPATVPSCAGRPVTDPCCSLRAQNLYMSQLLRLFADSPAGDRWAFAWAAYNGGYGWIRREKYRCSLAVGCNPRLWWGHVAGHCIRADWACSENRAYPDKILRAMPAFMPTGAQQ